MTEGEFSIDDKRAEELRAHYELLQRKVDAYQGELSRAFAEWRIKRGDMKQAHGGGPPEDPLFCVYGESLALDKMADMQDYFLKNRPENKRVELMFLLHEKEEIKKIRDIMKEVEDFLRLLPGASIPGRPADMKELMKIRI